MAGEAQQLRMSTYPRAGWRGLIGNADVLHMCLITHLGAYTNCDLARLKRDNNVYVYHNRVEKSKMTSAGSCESEGGSSLMWGNGGYELEVCTADCACLSPGPGSCFSPSSAHLPQESQAQQQYGSIMGSHCSHRPPVACKKELKNVYYLRNHTPGRTDLICDILDSPAWNLCSGRVVRGKAVFNKIACIVGRGCAGGQV